MKLRNGYRVKPFFQSAESEHENDAFFAKGFHIHYTNGARAYDGCQIFCWGLNGQSLTLPDYDMMELVVPQPINSFQSLGDDAVKEAEKAMKSHPQPNYVITKLAEESGETVKAAIHCAENRYSYSDLRDEMKQTIAMLYRLYVEGDQVHGLKPVGEMI